MLRNAQVQTTHNIHDCKYKSIFMFFPLDAPQCGLRTQRKYWWDTQHPLPVQKEDIVQGVRTSEF